MGIEQFHNFEDDENMLFKTPQRVEMEKNAVLNTRGKLEQMLEYTDDGDEAQAIKNLLERNKRDLDDAERKRLELNN